MQENHLFEYAVLRIVPRVEREEFINVGVILYCKKHSFLQTVFSVSEERLLALDPATDVKEIQSHLEALSAISAGKPGSGPIAALDLASRFRWLTAKRSTVVQTSPVHPGLCKDPATTLQRLHEQLVLC
jgi:hypothetical protein